MKEKRTNGSGKKTILFTARGPMTIDRVADMAGVDLETVRSRLKRGMKAGDDRLFAPAASPQESAAMRRNFPKLGPSHRVTKHDTSD